MARISTCLAAALLSVVASHASAQITDFKPVTEEMLANPDPADWLMISRTFDQHRFSPLNQINKDNVGQLRMAWTRGLPAGTQESTPIVYRGVMYMNAPGGSIQAVDATNGDLIWEYERDYPKDVNPRASRAQEPRHLRGHDLFRRAGRLPGRARRQDRQGPLGNQGRQRRHHRRRNAGRRRQGDDQPHLLHQGSASSASSPRTTRRTGKEVWKFYTTAAPGEPGGDTWADMPVEQRAAGPWGLPGSYDPKRKVIYWGIANPNPYTRLTRHGSHDAVSAHGAVESLQQFDGRARHRDRQARLVLPGTAGRRLGRRSQPGTHPGAHAASTPIPGT